MRLTITALVCVTTLGLTTATGSAETAFDQATVTNKAPKTAAKPTAVRVDGKVSAVDESSNMLTVTTTKGSQEFMLSTTTHITQGSKAIDVTALGKLMGHDVTVRYMEEGGHKMAQSVRVSAAAAKTATKKS